MFSVELTEQPRRFFRDADRPLAKKLARCFEQLERDPHHHPNIKPLTGPLRGYWRYRIGDHRVVYRIEENLTIVIVLLIAHRSEAYE